MKARNYCSFIMLVLLAGLMPPMARAAATFTVTPAAVSNTYSGFITLLISNVPTGDPVVVRKFLDLNTNGIIDGNDWLVQQFTVTDGTNFVIGGATNLSVPGDLNSTTGAITATLNFRGGDFIQNLVGRYIYEISSPLGHFPPVTNLFTVTNFPYPQGFTGSVVSNGTSTTLSNAVVILFPAPRAGDHGPGNPVGGTVASRSGSYSIQVPPGTYVPLVFRSNYVADYSASPVLTLGSQTINTNVSVTVATSSISGRVVDAINMNVGLPGVFEPAMNNSGLITVAFSDTNGNFNLPVTAGIWNIGSDDSGLIVHGYVGYQNGTNVNAGTSGVIGPFYRATAMFYGSVKDNLGNPLTGIDVYAYDMNNNFFQSDGYSDPNGKYAVGIVGGLGANDPWGVQVSNGGDSGNPANYIFSQPDFDQNGGTNVAVGQAVKVSFTAMLATNTISGNVQDNNGNNIAVVGVWAIMTTNGASFSQYVDTDSNGNYSMNVASGNWSVGVECSGGSDSLSQLGSYDCPNSQNVTINNNNGAVNFVVQSCSGPQITTTSPLPSGAVNTYYSIQLQGSTCSGNMNWSVNDPQDLPPGLTLYSGGAFNGTPNASGTYNFSVNLNDGNGNSTNETFSLNIAGVSTPLQITTSYLPNGTNGIFYSQTLQASGGTPPYSWSMPVYSSSLPANLTLATNGVLSGTPATTPATTYFDVIVTDAAANTMELDGLALTIVSPPLPPLVITNISLPNGNVGAAYSAQLGATGGQTPYNWSLALGSANPPPGLSLNPAGLISGTPTTNGLSYFKVQATDSNSTVTNKVFGLIINPKPSLGLPAWFTNQFRMRLTGGSNQNYTVQVSTNLSSSNWASLFITNNPATNSFMLTDPNATNKQRFYRVLIGP